VHAVEGVPAAASKQVGDRLVRGDHQLLDEHVRERLGLDPGPLDPALPVERERDLAPLDAERTACEAPVTERRGELPCEAERLVQLVHGALLTREDGLRVAVREPLAAPDEAAIEAGLAGLETGVERDLHGDAAAVLVGSQAAEVVGELVRQHRLDPPGHVDGEGALGGVVVEGRPSRDVRGDVGDVHPGAGAAALLAPEAERVVEVLGLLRVDREGVEPPQVDPVGLIVRRERRKRRMGVAHALVPEQALEHRLDPARGPEHVLDLRAAAARAHDHEVSGPRVARALAVEDNRDAAFEVGVADEQLPSPGQLADEDLRVQTGGPSRRFGGSRAACGARSASPRRAL
jgi:hypothetical protein